MIADVTFGITSFNRPHLLEGLIASILKRYPAAHIVVADNGHLSARLPASTRILKLPFDCGLSAARNALIDALETKYLLVLEDDFQFTDETNVGRLRAVLEHDPEVGCVGGSIRGKYYRVSAYSMDFEPFRDVLYVREATHRLRSTPHGVTYRLCDMVWNFALFRREMLAEHRWIDKLKVGEHTPFFYEIKKAARWRVACVPDVVCYHIADDRSRKYLAHRRRAGDFFREYLTDNGFNDYRRMPPRQYVDERQSRPSAIVLGVGHSGTSILVRMMHAAGWEAVDADRQFAESVSVRKLNQFVQRFGYLPPGRARRLLAALPSPWAVKDPRFVTTLHHWLPHLNLLGQQPALVRIVRRPEDILASYRRRGAAGDLETLVRLRTRQCQEQYERWPWAKMTIEYERLGAAASLFEKDRGKRTTDNMLSPLPLQFVENLRRQGTGQQMLLGEHADGEIGDREPGDGEPFSQLDGSPSHLLHESGSGWGLAADSMMTDVLQGMAEGGSGWEVGDESFDGSGDVSIIRSVYHSVGESLLGREGSG